MLLKTFSQDQKPLRIITKPKSITQAQITELIGREVDSKCRKRQKIRYCSIFFCLSSLNFKRKLSVTFCIVYDTKDTDPN